MSLSPDFATAQGQVLDINEVVNVRGCTVATMPDGQGGMVTMMRGLNQQAMANLCSPANPAAWTYQDVDAAPVSMPYPLVSGANPSNFRVTLSDGTTHNPICVNMIPANEDNEMKTINVFGESWGDGRSYTTYPVKIEIIGDVFFNVNGKLVNGLGLTFTEQDDTYDFMKYTGTLRVLEAKAIKFHSRGDGSDNDCHDAGFTGTTKVIKVRLSGGGTRNGIAQLQGTQTSAFVLQDAAGNTLDTGYLGVAGLNNDGDNNFDLCLDDTFDMNALKDVYLPCTGTDVIVPPKGSDFPCAAHSMQVDKSRMSADYTNACKCDFDHHYDAVCDPDSRLPASHPASGKNYCKVFAPTSTCTDIFQDAQGNDMSYEACSYRRPEWTDELTQCLGLTADAKAPTAEICRTNCEEDDACEVYQFTDAGACNRGVSTSCSGSLNIVAGGRKVKPAPPNSVIVDFGYPNCGAGWFDVQGQGVANDYCRWVGNCGCRGSCSWWSCALAGTTNPYTLRDEYTEYQVSGPFSQGADVSSIIPAQPNSVIVDFGYPNCGAGWFDVQGQGVANDYCRWVGNCGCRGSCSWWSCALAGTTNPYTLRDEYNEYQVSGPFSKGASVSNGRRMLTNTELKTNRLLKF